MRPPSRAGRICRSRLPPAARSAPTSCSRSRMRPAAAATTASREIPRQHLRWRPRERHCRVPRLGCGRHCVAERDDARRRWLGRRRRHRHAHRYREDRLSERHAGASPRTTSRSRSRRATQFSTRSTISRRPSRPEEPRMARPARIRPATCLPTTSISTRWPALPRSMTSSASPRHASSAAPMSRSCPG